MRYFRTCLNHAFENHLKKVTFIHGVGRGILRDEIMAELKKYDNIAVMDAPMRKYGAGAVEVYFK
jgi:dsDNA-specific endonuclease/ATPase MutS2